MDKVVKTVEECVDAAKKFGMAFHKVMTVKYMPAGCFYEQGTPDVYFNEEVDPSQTVPILNSGAICSGAQGIDIITYTNFVIHRK